MLDVKYDGSSRFFKYITQHGVPSYISKPTAVLPLDSTFVYKCGISESNVKEAYERRPLVSGNIDVLPQATLRMKKCIPPKLTKSQLKKLHMISTTENLIAFPISLINSKYCSDPKTIDNKRHVMIAVLNKVNYTVEVFDDCLSQSNYLFSIGFLLKYSLSDFILPKLQTLLSKNAPTLQLVVPRFHERSYSRLITILANGGYPADNNAAHAAFTANYIKQRVTDPAASSEEINKRVIHTNPTEFLLVFDELRKTWTISNAILNPETLRYVKTNGKKGKKLQGILIEPSSQKLNIHEYFMDEDASPDYLEKSEIGGYRDIAMRYLAAKYGDITHTLNEFRWNGVKLYAPKRFNAEWKEAMSTPKRYVVFGIVLESGKILEAHANALVYDKETRILERYEPNGGSYGHFDQQGLDKALQSYFSDKIGFYNEPNISCPLGLQDIEGDENNDGAKNIGGNCAAWSLYYMELRLANPTMTAKEVVNHAAAEIKRRGSFKLFINGYHRHVTLQLRKFRVRI